LDAGIGAVVAGRGETPHGLQEHRGLASLTAASVQSATGVSRAA
jgi:hypothetical protein